MLRIVVVFACAMAVVLPSPGFAGAPKCRADDPAAAGDADAVQAVRQQVDTNCPCASFPADGSKSRHGDYVKCAKGIVKTAVDGGQLRAGCRKLALYPFAFSTCGYPAEPRRVPCVKSTKKGPACRITTCTGAKDLACPERDDCLAAADTNHDHQVSALDSGQCDVLDCAAVTTLPQAFLDDRLDVCYDGCRAFGDFYIYCLFGCGAAEFDYAPFSEVAAAIRDVCGGDPGGTCDALHAASLQYCATPPPLPQQCIDLCVQDPICEAACRNAADCTAIADAVYDSCVQQQD